MIAAPLVRSDSAKRFKRTGSLIMPIASGLELGASRGITHSSMMASIVNTTMNKPSRLITPVKKLSAIMSL
jgi:hypothetical protein